MKKTMIILLAAVATVFSCQKVSENEVPATQEKMTFTVSAPETKTTLDGVHVKWAAGDRIRVMGYTDADNKGEATFVLKSGANTSTAVFEIEEGQSLGSYTNYYAIYPATAVVNLSDLSSGKITVSSSLGLDNQTPVENGFDPTKAVMTAKYEGGKLVFRHGVAFIRIKIAMDGITGFKFEHTGSANCNKPSYDAGTGAPTDYASGIKSVTATGTFVNGSYYYFPVIARPTNPGTITLTFTKAGSDASCSTTSLSSKRWVQGEIYDLGAPVVSFNPTVKAADVDIAKDATGGSIAYTVGNPAGDGVLTASVVSSTPAGWLTLGAVSASTVAFTCEANTGSDARTATVRLTYTYDTDKTSTKDVVVTQAGDVVVLTPVTTATSWASSFTALKADKGTGDVTEAFIYDNLGFVTGGSKFKFGTDSGVDRVQLGGTGSLTKCCLEFLVGGPGKVTVTARSSGDAARTLVICLGGTIKENTTGNAPGKGSSAAEISVNLPTATSGQKVSIYSSGSAINVYDVTWTPAS